MTTQTLCAATVFAPEVWDNKGRPRRRVNVNRDLTHSSDFTREGLAMKATRRPTAEQSFWAKVDKRGPDECWPWTASVTGSGGYGTFCLPRHNGSQERAKAHRFAYQLTHGSIPKGMYVCHRCDNPPCCNPAHLWLGTPTENAVDMVAKGRGHNQHKTHCPARHEYTEANTYVNTHGQRICRACGNDRKRRNYARKAAA